MKKAKKACCVSVVNKYLCAFCGIRSRVSNSGNYYIRFTLSPFRYFHVNIIGPQFLSSCLDVNGYPIVGPCMGRNMQPEEVKQCLMCVCAKGTAIKYDFLQTD